MTDVASKIILEATALRLISHLLLLGATDSAPLSVNPNLVLAAPALLAKTPSLHNNNNSLKLLLINLNCQLC